jgi:ketopantoate reductase
VKIAIIGAGAIGGLIGGLLAEDNKDIVIVEGRTL